MTKDGDLYSDEIGTCLEVMEEELLLMEEDSSFMEEVVILKNTEKRDAILHNTAIEEGLEGLLKADGSQFSGHIRSRVTLDLRNLVTADFLLPVIFSVYSIFELVLSLKLHDNDEFKFVMR